MLTNRDVSFALALLCEIVFKYVFLSFFFCLISCELERDEVIGGLWKFYLKMLNESH